MFLGCFVDLGKNIQIQFISFIEYAAIESKLLFDTLFLLLQFQNGLSNLTLLKII